MIVNLANTLLTGGAAMAARRLHHGLLEAGVDSRFWHDPARGSCDQDATYRPCGWDSQPRGPILRVHDRWFNRRRRRRVRGDHERYLAGRPQGGEPFSPALQRHATPWPADRLGHILHLHWVGQWIDHPSFFASIPDYHPIVWTLHDQNPLSGGCHFSQGCRAFESGCGNCPQLDAAGPLDLSHQTYAIKRQALAGKNLHVVAPSRWLTEQARRSPLLEQARSFHTIPYGLDLQAFHPIDKLSARRQLGLAEADLVLAFGADSLTNSRKGVPLLLSALNALSTPRPVTCLAFGGGEIPPAGRPRDTIRSLGFIDDPARQALVYSAADLFVLPSLEDNLPQTGLESLACGTPVVGFAAGGIPELIEDGRTGLLAATGDWRALARCIDLLAANPAVCRRMASDARSFAVRNYDLWLHAQRHIGLYERLRSEVVSANGRPTVQGVTESATGSLQSKVCAPDEPPCCNSLSTTENHEATTPNIRRLPGVRPLPAGDRRPA